MVAAALAATQVASAQQAPAEGPTIKGTVTGELAKGRRVTFHITATHPDGWQSLKTLNVVLSLEGVPLEELSYGVDTTSVRAGVSSALVGTGDQVTGRFFAVDALNIRVATGADRLDLTMDASLLEDVPEGARFQFVAEDDVGEEASVNRVALTPQEEGGFPWATVIAVTAVALLAGGFLGSRVTAHRAPPTKSIYQDVARRILEERERKAGG
jgi:hypothetical protein